jgi:hypothetical protein
LGSRGEEVKIGAARSWDSFWVSHGKIGQLNLGRGEIPHARSFFSPSIQKHGIVKVSRD